MSINHPKWTGLSSLPNGKMLICPAEFVTGREAEGPAQSGGSSVTSAGERGRTKGNNHFHITRVPLCSHFKNHTALGRACTYFFQSASPDYGFRRLLPAIRGASPTVQGMGGPGPAFRKPTHSFSLAQTARTGKISDFSWTKETLTISNLSLVSFYRNKTCAAMIQKCSSRDCQSCFTPAPPS